MSERTLSVLGATGTIGRNTLDVVRRHPERVTVHALTAHRDADALADLCIEFRPRLAALADAAATAPLKDRLAAAGVTCEVVGGDTALCDAATGADLVMSAIVGAAGLKPTLAAVQAGKRVLIANKEPVVMAGRLLLDAAAASGAELVPIDSEHNAIFQCLPGGFRCGTPAPSVRKLVLTASGGPFRDTPVEALARVTPEQAVRHPNWVMGPKISVDSATMLNKGLELIEAHRLFGVPEQRMDVVLHPESVVHSLVEYVDGSMLAQLGQPDMRVPIAHALAWPQRWTSGVEGVDLARIARLNFEPVDLRRFPGLGLARRVLRDGGVLPNVLNAANEVAVAAFLAGRIPFTGIVELIESVLSDAAGESLPAEQDLDAVLAVDDWARACATRQLAAVSGAVRHA